MAEMSGTARSTATIGVIELGFALAAVISGGVAMSKITSPAGVTIGLWALYFAVPGILCIASRYSENTSFVGFALAANIIGTILAGAGLILGALLWAILNSTCDDASCSDLKVVRNATAFVTIAYLILLITSFVGSIFGCMATCCAPREPTVVISGTIPVQPSTIVVSSQSTSYSNQAYPAMAQQGYPASVNQQAYAGEVLQPAYPSTSPPNYDGPYNPPTRVQMKVSTE